MDFRSTFAAIPTIVIMVYLVAELFKQIFKGNKTAKGYIPIICGATGLILGVLCYNLWPSVIGDVDNAFTAGAIGIFSGFSATGINQVWKQITKNSNVEEETKTEN